MFCYFCMCYAGYDGIGETCWCWDAAPESDSWVMESADWETVDSTVCSYDLISKVSTNGVFILTSRLCHVWLCDVASPITSWHRLRWGGVTFGRLAVSDFELGVDVIDFDECYCYLFTVLYCDVQFWSILDSVCWKVKVRCIFSVLVLVYSGLDVSRCQRSI